MIDDLLVAVATFAQEACKAADAVPQHKVRFGTYLTRKEMSILTKVPPATISALVNGSGKHLPSLVTLARLAKASGKKLKLSLGD